MRRRLRRDIRLLKAYAAISTLAITVLTGLGLAQVPPARQRFQEIDVERINVIERDGRVRLVLSNAERQAEAVIDGRTIAPGRRRPAGMIFFNEVGDEVGGLIFSGQTQNGTPQASGSLTFDQFRQDQTVALQYVESGGRRRAGLAIIDRPETSLAVAAELYEKRAAASDAARADVEREIAARVGRSATRVFVGRDLEGRSSLVLSDAQGNPRLSLSVDGQGAPRIQFLDASGKPVRELTP